MDMLILFLSKVFLALHLSVDGTGDVVTAVADALYLSDLTKHGANLCLGVIAEMRIADHIEVFGYLYLHGITDILVFLDARIEFVELVVVFDCQQLTHEAKHTLDALGKRGNLFLCLQHRELWGLHDGCATDITQAELLFHLVVARFDDAAHEFLYLRDKPDEHKGVGDVEAGMEGSEDDG